MNRNKKGFNLFNNEMAFVLPQPIPEPPRVLNPRPMVPDLSITSDMSLNGLPFHQNDNYSDKFRTLYVSPKQCSPPKGVSFGQHFANNFQLNFDRNQTFGHKCVSNPTLNSQKDNFNQQIKGFVSNDNITNGNKNNIFTNGRLTEDKPIESQLSVKPKIVRHSKTSDPVVKGMKQTTFARPETKFRGQTTNDHKSESCPTNTQMFEIIRQQDIQLQKISEQIEELLKIHKIRDNREQEVNQNNCSKRSVQTMTSLVFENNETKTPLNKSKNNVKSSRSSSKTPSTATKDLRGLALNTISEFSETSEIELDSNRLNFSESPIRRLNESSSIEKFRKKDDNSYDDPFYGRMINDIEVMLQNGSSDDTDSGRRSSCSPTPPHSRRTTQERDRRHRVELQTEQTLYIKRLAAKYLVESEDSSDYKTKPKHRTKRTEQKVFRTERSDLNVYGLTKNASIATKDYLEKYGLTYSPPKVQKNLNFLDNKKTKPKLNRNKILDIEALKRQHKLT